MEYYYWEINYISCEGNKRYVICRAPIDWDEDDIINKIPIGGCGDDVSNIVEVYETSNTNYHWDFTDF